MRLFQVAQAVVCHTQLLFQHRHPLGKVVVGAHFAGQLLQAGIRDRLGRYHPLFRAAGSHHVGDNHPQQAQSAGDQRHQNCFHPAHTSV